MTKQQMIAMLEERLRLQEAQYQNCARAGFGLVSLSPDETRKVIELLKWDGEGKVARA